MKEKAWSKFLLQKKQWPIVLLVGILLMVIAMPAKTRTQNETAYSDASDTTTDMERRLENTLENMKQVGDVHVMMTMDENDAVEGIVVLAEGGGNAVVVRNITEVVQALFNVDSHKIKVIEKKSNL